MNNNVCFAALVPHLKRLPFRKAKFVGSGEGYDKT